MRRKRLDPALVEKVKNKNMDYMDAKMFEFGSWKEATTKGGKKSATPKWADHEKKDEEGHVRAV